MGVDNDEGTEEDEVAWQSVAHDAEGEELWRVLHPSRRLGLFGLEHACLVHFSTSLLNL